MPQKKKKLATSTKPSKKAASTRRPAGKTPARAVKTTAAVGSQAKKAIATGNYSDRDVLALENALSVDEALEVLNRLKRFSPAPSDEIFGDEPTWWFDGKFGTHAPVELGDYSENHGLSLLEVRCRDAVDTLIASRSDEAGWMRDMLVVLSILNAELERHNRPNRVYSIIQPSWPAVLLLDDRLATAAKILRQGEDGALSQAELEREYQAATKDQQRIPWRQQ